MPQIYTKEEVDKLLEEASKFIKSVDIAMAKSLELLNEKITKVYNELFSMTSDNTNMIHLLMEEKKKQTNGVKSPYAR